MEYVFHSIAVPMRFLSMLNLFKYRQRSQHSQIEKSRFAFAVQQMSDLFRFMILMP